jgi:hypothetical protein
VFNLKKTALIALVIAVLVSVFAFSDSTHIGGMQTLTEVNGIISSDTWTKANSPYTLTGPVVVNNGAILSIEPGVTVNLNAFYIRVNGTLTAKGNSTDQIHFNGGYLYFTAVSSSWNEQTGSGSIIENAVLTPSQNLPRVIYTESSPRISNSSIKGILVLQGNSAASISGNNIAGIEDSSAIGHTISNNKITLRKTGMFGRNTYNWNNWCPKRHNM